MPYMSISRKIACVALLSLLSTPTFAGDPQQSHMKPTSVEFSVKWNPIDGGPKSAKKAAELLNLAYDDPDNYFVQYYSFDGSKKGPKGAKGILRHRIKNQKKEELTIKYRSDKPFELESWACPMSGTDGTIKYEIDTSLLADQKQSQAYSLSCDLEDSTAINTELTKQRAEKLDCPVWMVRSKIGAFKAEEWHICSDFFIEISSSKKLDGDDFQEALKSFQTKIVDVLTHEGAKPLSRSKTDAASDCR